ncbi:ribosome small subunit-dependent GTPase A [Jeotgalibacillus proteolyticus]|uniref:Small ribosomal subunit biogenesis GTPase RsgA n=1 Tax=Jeotgalibacillus proteolyticus TaxID=2082395 RepID=A0A2S5GGK7_9BACL|nr:ribosome small subunit-dependent GTPase A [Jeotgalibacillus proteolyticus]PPA72098.1 ribosome small subunit-dependent GTPase A [Jeotgalibacillus proteolyticus]
MPEGKIMKALSGFYYVKDHDQIIQCRGRGIFRKQKITPLVGDYVVYQAENDLEGYVTEIKERKNELMRPPVANVDQAVLVFSAIEPAFSTSLLDRFLVLVESHHISPVICISKMDLLSQEETEKIEKFAVQYEGIGYTVIRSSAKWEDGLTSLLPYLEGKISVFAGQSGVGKSSILNALRPDLELKTDQISSSLGRGKHTTRHVELWSIGSGLVADTPGFSALEFSELELEELPGCFPEIADYGERCKFRGCLHINEPKCAVKKAVEENEIPAYRYHHYQQFYDEIKTRKPRY